MAHQSVVDLERAVSGHQGVLQQLRQLLVIQGPPAPEASAFNSSDSKQEVRRHQSRYRGPLTQLLRGGVPIYPIHDRQEHLLL